MTSGTPRRAFADTRGGQIHYMISGEGKPVLLLHQTPRSSDEYLEVLPLLGQKFRAIAMDTVGFGDSYKPTKKCTVEDFARGVIDFLDALEITRTHIVGHHTGAVIGVELAASYPERVDKLVLSACPWYDDEKRAALKDKPVMDADESKEDGSHLLSLWRRRMAFYPKGRIDLLERFMADALVAGDNKSGGHTAVKNYRMEDKYGKVKCPTLLVCGTEDMFTFPTMPKVAEKIGGSKMVSITGGTVALPNQLPQEFADIILQFLSG